MYSRLTPTSHVVALLSPQAAVSSHPSAVSQLSGPNSHGLGHLASRQNTDLLHLRGFHREKKQQHFLHLDTQRC